MVGVALVLQLLSPSAIQAADVAPSASSVPTAKSDWVRGGSKHFIGYSDGSESQLREALIELERFDALLRQRTRVDDGPTATKVTVYLLRNATVIKEIAQNKNVRGLYSMTLDGAYMVVPRVSGQRGDRTLYHEYAHHLMMQHFNATYPAWYVEGFAEFMSTTEFDKDGKAKLGMPLLDRSHSLLNGPRIPIQQLLSGDTSGASRDEGGAFYARAWLLTHFLTFTPERACQLTKYLTGLDKGQPSLASAEAAFGDLTALDKALDVYVRKPKLPYIQYNAAVAHDQNVTVTSAPPGDGEAHVAFLALRRASDAANKAQLLTELQDVARRFPHSAAAQVRLAEAAFEDKRYRDAIVAADAALAINPNTAAAHVWRGSAMAAALQEDGTPSAADLRAARTSIVRGNRLDPANPFALYAYYRALAQSGDPVSETAKDGLASAFHRLPQQPTYRFALARMFAEEGDYARAIALFDVVANSPHDSPSRRYARAMISLYRKAEQLKVKPKS